MAKKKSTTKKTTTRRKSAARGRDSFTLHVISDATGGLARRMLNAVLTQFPDVEIEEVFHAFQDSGEKIRKTIESIPGGDHHFVVHALAVPELKLAARSACVERRIPHYDLTGPLADFIAANVGRLPVDELSRLHKVDHDYFRRIEAMEFTSRHDDSQNLETIDEADIVIVGLSRLSKSPTATYLGSLGFKTANVSISPQIPVPKELAKVKKKIVALTIQPRMLRDIRSRRLVDMGVDGTTDYADMQAIIKEIMWAESIFEDRGYHILDVSDMTIEKTASMILQTLNLTAAGKVVL